MNDLKRRWKDARKESIKIFGYEEAPVHAISSLGYELIEADALAKVGAWWLILHLMEPLEGINTYKTVEWAKKHLSKYIDDEYYQPNQNYLKICEFVLKERKRTKKDLIDEKLNEFIEDCEEDTKYMTTHWKITRREKRKR